MTGQAKARGISALPTGYLLHQTIDIKNERKFQLATQSFFLLIVLAAGTAALVLLCLSPLAGVFGAPSQ